MGWEVTKDGEGFILRDDKARSLRFTGEPDSHEAGEAVRAFLGRPRLSEVVAEKEKVDRELAELKAANQKLIKDVLDLEGECDELEGLLMEAKPGWEPKK